MHKIYAKNYAHTHKNCAKNMRASDLINFRKVMGMRKRKTADKREQWHRQKNKKALLLGGARQAGKTFSVRESDKNYVS
ncbi:MAG: hypothetical protein IJI75_10160 [Solobacterium sp.]|nr:hypothetical protein [Solobacterium sp.]